MDATSSGGVVSPHVPGRPLRIAMVSGDISRRGAGVASAVEALSQGLVERGNEVCVFALDTPQWRAGDRLSWRGGPTRTLPVLGPQGLGYCPDLAGELRAWGPDIVHVHGLWLLTTLSILRWKAAGGCPFVISTHGMLAPGALRYSRLKKFIANTMYQKRALKDAACLHATSERELSDIRRLRLRQPIAVVPHGINPPPKIVERNSSYPFVLSLGRIHPIKGLDLLIRAWALIELDFPNWRLEIRGPSEGSYSRELENLVRQLGLQSVTISDAVYGPEKYRLMAEAELFILPSLNENFAVTVAESLASGTPVISTKGAPWAGLATNQCGWWIDHDHKLIADTIRQAILIGKEKRSEMGLRGQQWMHRDFGWDSVAHRMEGIYRWLAWNESRPSCVTVA